MHFETVVEEFLKEFPEYTAAYNEHIEFHNEVLAHVFFGDEVLEEDLLALLSENRDKEKLEKIFSFFERMAVEGDVEVKSLLSVTILARIGDDDEILRVAYTYMGKNTRIDSDEIERFWGRKKDCPSSHLSNS